MNRLLLGPKVSVPKRPIILVHGFQYDPDSTGNNNPNTTFFPLIQSRIPWRKAEGFAYYSAPAGIKSVWRSWMNGRWNRYRYAWDLAEEAGKRLRKQIQSKGEEVDIICHSLGSRVVRSTFEGAEQLPVKRVLLLNGAEHTDSWEEIIRRGTKFRTTETEFMNVCVETDDVLEKMGGLFSPGRLYGACVGQRGLRGEYQNWVDVPLNGGALEWGKQYGWTLRGNDPTGYWDHWYSYRYEPNWELYSAWLNGRLKLENPVPFYH